MIDETHPEGNNYQTDEDGYILDENGIPTLDRIIKIGDDGQFILRAWMGLHELRPNDI